MTTRDRLNRYTYDRYTAAPEANDLLLIDVLLALIAEKHSLTAEELRGKSHESSLVAARRQFVKEARVAGYSLPAIGRALRRHHTSVLYLERT